MGVKGKTGRRLTLRTPVAARNPQVARLLLEAGARVEEELRSQQRPLLPRYHHGSMTCFSRTKGVEEKKGQRLVSGSCGSVG